MSANTELAKWGAFVAMLLSHVGDVFGVGQPWLWLVGRVAVPTFAALVAYNVLYRTRSPAAYAERLFGWALVSQIPFALCGYEGLNVLFTLAAAVVAVTWRREKLLLPIVTGLALVEVWIGWRLLDGGMAAIGFAVAVAALLRNELRWSGLGYAGVCLGAVVWFSPFGFVAAVAGTLALFFAPVRVPVARGIPGWVWYALYPGHLAAYAAIYWIGGFFGTT